MSQLPALMTLAEVAAALRVSDETVRKQLVAGTGPLRGVKVGDQWRVTAESVRRLLGDAEGTPNMASPTAHTMAARSGLPAAFANRGRGRRR